MTSSTPMNISAKFFVSTWLLVATLIFYIDLWPLWADLYELINQGGAISQQIAEKEKVLQKIHTHKINLTYPLSSKCFNEQIIESVLVSHGKLKKVFIKPESEDKPNQQGMRVHLKFIGKFNSVYYFWQTIYQHKVPVILEEFSLKKVDGWLESSWWLRAFPLSALFSKVAVSSMPSTYCCKRDPFESAVHTDNDDETSLTQMQYVGYMEENNQIEALILLPNGIITNIHEGGLLGKERASIIKITQTEIILIDPKTKKTQKITKEESKSV